MTTGAGTAAAGASHKLPTVAPQSLELAALAALAEKGSPGQSSYTQARGHEVGVTHRQAESSLPVAVDAGLENGSKSPAPGPHGSPVLAATGT